MEKFCCVIEITCRTFTFARERAVALRRYYFHAPGCVALEVFFLASIAACVRRAAFLNSQPFWPRQEWPQNAIDSHIQTQLADAALMHLVTRECVRVDRRCYDLREKPVGGGGVPLHTGRMTNREATFSSNAPFSCRLISFLALPPLSLFTPL